MIERLAAQGRQVVLPRIESGEALPVTYRPGDPVSGTAFGAMEPSAGALVDPERLDAVVMPGVAFDRAGNRVGYGGGYYDRLLGRTRADIHTIAVAFAVQLVDAVPVGHQDRRVDIVVTEDEVIRCGGA
jgi:5-formyltetrahydrofolate cyclo-ligase